jgi:UDP-GlcNAc:undecaprenyl-phosphate/decaprenyl-phosphate GlcNAc-1-phosphate transferase
MTYGPAIGRLAGQFLMAFAISAALVPVCRALSRRYGKVAHPREDRWHRRPVALFGGVAMGVTLVVCATIFGLYRDVPVLLTCATLAFLVGLVDDFLTLKPSTKLIAQIAIASAVLFFGYRLFWVGSITADSLLTLVWVVGVTNAFNLLDNMDGLCAGISLIVAATLLFDLVPRGAAGVGVALPEAQYLAMLGGATAGFLIYNLHPATIFMGDSGAFLIGFSLAALTLTHAHEAARRSNLLSVVAVPVLVLLIPIFDSTFVTVVRVLSGRSVAVGGRDHSSHRLVAIGLSERKAVIVLWLLAAVGGAIAIAMTYISLSWSVLIGVVFVLMMVLIAIYLARIRVYEGEDARLLREGTVTPLVVEFMYKRRVAEVLLDFSLIVIAYYAAYRFRFEGEEFMKNFGSFRNSLPVVVTTQMIAFFGVGVYRGVWRYFGLSDAVVIAKGVFIGTAVAQLLVLYSPWFIGYSRTVFAIYAVLLVGFVTLSRASFLLIGEFVNQQRRASRRAIVYGAGDAGALAVRELLKSREESIRIVGFVDDDPQKRGTRVRGYRVIGDIATLIQSIAEGQVDSVIVSSRSIPEDTVRAVAAAGARHGVSVTRLRVGLEEVTFSGRDDDSGQAMMGGGKSLPFPPPGDRKPRRQ